MTVNEKLLKALKSRTSKRTEFNYGITTADRYVKTVEQCVGHSTCDRYGCSKSADWSDVIRKASETLTYSNPDMVLDIKESESKILTSLTDWKKALSLKDSPDLSEEDYEKLELPKNTLIAFTHTLTTPRKDRDGDVLRSEGAIPDPKMLLLWQHIPTLPIGKMVAVLEKSKVRLRNLSAIVDMNELCHDAAVMVDNGMMRFSHGFRALEFDDLKDSEEYDDGTPNGFDITSYEIMEESGVSIPSNVDAETEETVLSLVEGGKLTSPFMKSYGSAIREKRPTQSSITYKERFGDYEREISTGCVGDFEKIFNGVKGEQHEDQPGSGSDTKEGGGQGKQGCTCGAPKEAKGTTEEETASSYPQVKSYKGNVPDDAKHFDIDKEELEASKLEYDWVSRFLSVPIKELMVVHTSVPHIRMGSFLTGAAEITRSWKLHDTRNITYDGKEIPPQHEVIQLNSRLSDTFLVEGIRFYKCDDGSRLVVKTQETWSGIHITCYSAQDEGSKYLGKCWSWAIENNFLKGEAFSLTGSFLKRKGIDWQGLFLDQKNLDPVRRSASVVNTKGADMPNRGMILMGPPGTGKTLSGRILMNQAKSTFIWVSARDFWRTGSIGGMCSAFDLAKELAPAILFIEDVDNWMSERTVDILKTEMDGIDQTKGVMTILTTNFPERLPEALIDRPGRFHDVLRFDLPDSKIRHRMLKYWLPDEASEKVITEIVKDTEGYSGAHVYELANFAKTLSEEDESSIDDSLKTALMKINEQRELITQTQLSGSNYRPRSTERTMAKSVVFVKEESTEDEKATCPECGGKMSDGKCEECGYEVDKAHLPSKEPETNLAWATGIILSDSTKADRDKLRRFMDSLDEAEDSRKAKETLRQLMNQS